MTKAEALIELAESEYQGYIGWDREQNQPDTASGYVILDGSFTRVELLALIAFFPVD